MTAARQGSEHAYPTHAMSSSGTQRRHPAIGVSMGHLVAGSRITDATETAYAHAVVSAGSVPLLVPALPAVPTEDIVERLDGLLLTGGGDVDPHRYGATPSPQCGHLDHLVPERPSATIHHVEVEEESQLARIVRSPKFAVNSIHHQAVEQAAPELAAVGRAGDGVVEAIEHPSLPVLGVQWHPENLLRHRKHHALFDWLISTAGRWSAPYSEPARYSETASARG
ncbi:MAG TPA: gamma-glutamyl-gamma-aminobutyrate hydrolase family protein [Acidimicrobiales bacterium]|nr:gamma-glutamyl-gamma-aminobutyrate hydrolase family protein [Acidimicrobiales bacterium]